LFIGQDHCGRWVVRDAQNLRGGLFANQKEAIRYAMYERQRRPQSVIMRPSGLELGAALDGGASRNPANRRATALAARCLPCA
jgi:hypothetical protein